MIKVVPSDVVAFIETWIGRQQLTADPEPELSLHADSAGQCLAIVDMVNAIPEELLILDGNDRAALAVAIAKLRALAARWQTGVGDRMSKVLPYRSTPLKLLWERLQKCPDEAPPKAFRQLSFITDAELRTSIELDIGAAHSALANGGFKGATVLAGAGIEALLLWGLQDKRIFPKLATLKPPLKVPATPADLASASWGLDAYISAATHISLLDDTTAKSVDLAKGYRNLIHPGKAQRTGTACDRGAAHGAIAGLERLIVRLGKELP